MIEHVVRHPPNSTARPASAVYRAVAFVAAGVLALLFIPSFQQRFELSDRVAMVGVPASVHDDDRTQVSVSGYFIDQTEVTVAAYRRCVDAGACSAFGLTTSTVITDGRLRSDPSPLCNWGHWRRGQHPLNCVSWRQARDYCRWARKRLPTKQEWTRAAAGAAAFPWGTAPPSCTYAVVDGCSASPATRQRDGATLPVGSKPAGRSPSGALDMVGNVAEWTADSILSPERSLVEVLGGSWANGTTLPSSRKGSIEMFVRDAATGFRCAR